MTTRPAREPSTIQSLGRGLTILEAVADAADPVPLNQLTAILGIDRSSVFRLANTLKRRRFLASPQGRKHYVLGPSVWRLFRKYGQNPLVTFAQEQLRALSAGTGETAHLAIRDSRQALFIDHSAPTSRVLAVFGQTGELVPLHCSAHGKALLADFTLQDLQTLFVSAPLTAFTKRTITSLPGLARACARIRAQGFATDDREHVDELRCVAAPIRDEDGSVVASIGISAPVSRFPKSRYESTARQVSEAATAITAGLRAQP